MSGKSNTGRRAAQRAVPIFEDDKCDRCLATRRLQRHHKDENPENNAPANIEILCQRCHKEAHMASGTWGKGRRLPDKTCPVCMATFRPHKATTLSCGRRGCISELGRRAAGRRWSRESQQE